MGIFAACGLIDCHSNSGLYELEHEFVLRLGRIGRILISGIVRVAQEIAFVDQLESRRFDFLPKKRLLDAMQGTGFGDTGTRPTRMISYNVEASRLPTIIAALTSELALTGRDTEARATLAQYLALESTRTRTIAQWSYVPDDNAAFMKFHWRFKSGLRKAGMPDQ